MVKKISLISILFLIVFSFNVLLGQGLAIEEWPKFHGPSLKNNGRSPYRGPKNPKAVLIFESGDRAYLQSLAVGPDGIIYFGNISKFYAIYPNGVVKWDKDITKSKFPTVNDNGYIYIGDDGENFMMKLETATGDPTGPPWPFDLNPYHISDPQAATIAPDGVLIFGISCFQGYDRYLIALNPDGTLKYKLPYINQVETCPAIDEDHGFIYIGNHNHEIAKINLETGAEINKIHLGGHGYVLSLIALSDDNSMIYFSDYSDQTNQGYIYGYDENLTEKMKIALGHRGVVPPALGRHGLVFTGGRGTNTLAAIDPSKEEVAWSILLDSDFYWAPPVVDINNVVYIVTQKYLWAIKANANEGVIEWKRELPEESKIQPALTSDGSIYVLSTTGNLYAFRDTIIDGAIEIHPDTLNHKSNGKWVTASIELPEGYDVNDIDLYTVAISKIDNINLPDPIYAESKPAHIGDNDGDGIADLMIKFSRHKLQDVLVEGYRAITITGTLTNGTEFSGSDTIRVIN